MRLQRYLASAGVAARRKCEEIIVAGRVSVNGTIVTVLGTKIDPDNDMVTVDGEAVAAHDHFYVLFNKPKGCITAVSDDRGRPTVMEYLPNLPVPVKPVGRLDFYSEGVLFLTNDGELASRLLSPHNHVEKTYHVKIHGNLTQDDLRRLREGITLDDGTQTLPAEVALLPGESRHSWLGITIHEGKHRQIHRMVEALGYRVDKLQRVAFGNLTFHDLRIGDARELNQLELNALRDLVELPHDKVARGTWRKEREETDQPRRAKQKVRDEAVAEAMEALHESDFEGTGDDGSPSVPRPMPRPPTFTPSPSNSAARSPTRPPRSDARASARPARSDGPRSYRGGQRSDGPRSDGPRSDGPRTDGPRSDGPRSDAPRGGNFGGPRSSGPRSDGPRGGSFGGPRSDGPRSSGPRSDGPRGGSFGGPRSDGPRSSGPRS
ncbi:MAG: pseudouridine synthase, partial [Proteobacteria bacterium]|nr:pseudouridine synthase [Pseudomonadota bacterium]